MNNIKRLLLKPLWSYKNIMTYTGWKKSKCYEVMTTCRKRYGGGSKEEPSMVTRDSVLAYLNTTIEREILIINEIKRR